MDAEIPAEEQADEHENLRKKNTVQVILGRDYDCRNCQSKGEEEVGRVDVLPIAGEKMVRQHCREPLGVDASTDSDTIQVWVANEAATVVDRGMV